MYYSDSSVSILKSAFAAVVDSGNNHIYKNISNTKIIDNIVTKSRQLFYLGDYQGTIKIIDNMLPAIANNTTAMNIVGAALDELGKPQEAIVWYDKALNQTKSSGVIDIDIISNKAYVLGVELKVYDLALSLTEQYLENNPYHKGLLCTTAEIYKETGNIGPEKIYSDQLTKLDPNYKCGLIEKSSELEKAFA
jgi:tetratricopeptide (TPR) repeat protein